MTSRRQLSSGLTAALLLLFYIFLLAPIAVVVVESFSSSEVMVFPPRGWSFRWFGAFANNHDFIQSFELSFLLAAVSGVVAGCIGTLSAYGLVRNPPRAKSALETLLMAPIYVPEVLTGMALLLAFSELTLAGSLAGLILAHVLITAPYVLRTVAVSVQQLDMSVEDAARVLGATRIQTFAKVTLPLIRPGVLAGGVFAFIISFSDIYMALFLAGPQTVTLPLRIYNYLQWEQTPIIAVVSTLQVLMIVIMVAVADKASSVVLPGKR